MHCNTDRLGTDPKSSKPTIWGLSLIRRSAPNSSIPIRKLCDIIQTMDDSINKITISVRDLVEFILRSGDIDNRSAGMDMTAAQDGSRLHKKLQKEAGENYRAEVNLKIEAPVTYDGESFLLCIEGRADGINDCEEPYIDEIKTTLRTVSKMEEPVAVHRSQAMCYAYIYAEQNGLDEIGIRMTYCNRDTEEIKYFPEKFAFGELKKWFDSLITEYAKWAAWEAKWKRTRNISIAGSRFPFEYREGQRDLVKSVYTTITRNKRLFIEAPTGVGKTISTVFPAVWAMGEDKVGKIFYGTAKTIARTVAEETFAQLQKDGMSIKCVTITSKEKLCVLDKPECNPIACPRAKGHMDRVNDAIYDLITHEDKIDRTVVEQYAEKHNVCPFEMSLDVSLFVDAVICDYNYIFDPTVHLKRYFDGGSKGQYIFLIDEAHNLVERARDMYSAEMVKEDFLAAKAALKKIHSDWRHEAIRDRLCTCLDACNKALLPMKRECDEFDVWEECDRFGLALMRFAGVFEDVSKDLSREESEILLDLYFDARHFLNMHDSIDDDYVIYTDYLPNRNFRLRLQCMEPQRRLKEYLEQARASIFFSATLLPIRYYMEQLGGRAEDYCVYAPSPFDTGKRLLMVGKDVSTKYTRRNETEFAKIAGYIETFVSARKGNYMVFFPSYKMMNDVADMLEGRIEGLVVQSQNMTEQEKEDFLDAFEVSPDSSRVGFCVMGGIFAEGIDLKDDRLIGVVVVGTGLPMVCNERELFRGYFDKKNHYGFEYAYLYSGMNKVMQAAGRVIRTTDDVGAILLLDERFLSRQYLELFPREWADYKVVSLADAGGELSSFWGQL